MPKVLPDTQTADTYTDSGGATIQQTFESQGGFCVLQDYVYCQLQYGDEQSHQGSEKWSDEFSLPPGAHTIDEGVVGVRFRSYTLGNPVIVSAAIFYPFEPKIRLGGFGISSAQTALGIINIKDPAYGAVGDGVVDDTGSIQSAFNTAIASGGKCIVYFPPADYKISGKISLKPASADILKRILVTGYGANIHLTTANSNITCSQNGFRFQYLIVEGLKFYVDSNLTTDAFVMTDNGNSTGNFPLFELRDLVVVTGTATAPINNGISIVGTSGAAIFFQFAITNCTTLQPINIAGLGISINAGQVTSVEITNPNTYGYLHGVQMGTSSLPVGGGNITDGTIVGAYNEGLAMYVQGGGFQGTHIEASWGVAPTAPHGGEVYIQGHGTILQHDINMNTAVNQTSGSPAAGLAKYGIEVFSGSIGTVMIGPGRQRFKTITTLSNSSGLISANSTAHGLITGDKIGIQDVLGTTEANTQWVVTVVDANNFTLNGSTFTHAYTSGGKFAKCVVFIRDATAAPGGTVRVEGIPSKFIDFSTLITTGSPTLDLWQPKTRNTATYGSSNLTIVDLDRGEVGVIIVTDGNPMTVQPINVFPGCELYLAIQNASGGAMGAVTFASNCRTAGAFVVPGNGKYRTITFAGLVVIGSQVVMEFARGTADI